MTTGWQHGWRTGFDHSIQPVVSVKPCLEGHTEERSFLTTISRIMSGHCSIRAHLERFRIVRDPICVCMINYETVDHIIWECSRFENSCRDSRLWILLWCGSLMSPSVCLWWTWKDAGCLFFWHHWHFIQLFLNSNLSKHSRFKFSYLRFVFIIKFEHYQLWKWRVTNARKQREDKKNPCMKK
jgi:hypothetical protein